MAFNCLIDFLIPASLMILFLDPKVCFAVFQSKIWFLNKGSHISFKLYFIIYSKHLSFVLHSAC